MKKFTGGLYVFVNVFVFSFVLALESLTGNAGNAIAIKRQLDSLDDLDDLDRLDEMLQPRRDNPGNAVTINPLSL